MSRSRILIADDDSKFTAALRQRLVSKNHAVVVTASRMQAQEIAQKDRPDMVLLGTMQPRGDAFKLYKWLKESPILSDTAIIVVDAPPEKQHINGWRKDEGLRLECDDYFARPVDVPSVVDRIEKLLDKTTERITVLVADDHAVVRDSIRAVIDLQKDMQVIAEAVDGREAISKTLEFQPDVVLMDIVMPNLNGMDATRQICQQWDKAKILVLSQYDDQETVRASSESGALGFIPKRSASSELIAGIRSVSQGKHLELPVAV